MGNVRKEKEGGKRIEGLREQKWGPTRSYSAVSISEGEGTHFPGKQPSFSPHFSPKALPSLPTSPTYEVPDKGFLHTTESLLLHNLLLGPLHQQKERTGWGQLSLWLCSSFSYPWVQSQILRKPFVVAHFSPVDDQVQDNSFQDEVAHIPEGFNWDHLRLIVRV